MTEYEKIVASAYTDTVFVSDFSKVHKYIEEKLGRPVWTHEMASSEFWEKVRDAARSDFLAMLGDDDQGLVKPPLGKPPTWLEEK